MKPKLARLFMNGGSQAVRLPAELRFDADEVYIRRDERTGDVILSSKPYLTWADFMEIRDQFLPESDSGDFLGQRLQSTESREPFRDWTE
ncbi:AbrB/MazE/SpoVT family DNA-binding domain-containing protein [bacterium]|nr:AbrB/MazE/SpoVT family DNA-binding domain-containing protein [bacterium]